MSLTPEQVRALRNHRFVRIRDLADTALALYERNEALEAVVRALAESADTPQHFAPDGVIRCRFCDCAKHYHDPSCPWRQARELTELSGTETNK